MITQPTQPQNLPDMPPTDHRRPLLMSALTLAEHLLASAELPSHVTIQGGDTIVEAKVVAHISHNIDMLHSWQARFGGEISHRISEEGNGRTRVYSSLRGRVFDAPFELWTVRWLTNTPEVAAAELDLCARWVAEHGAPCDWCAQSVAAYLAERAELLSAVAA